MKKYLFLLVIVAVILSNADLSLSSERRVPTNATRYRDPLIAGIFSLVLPGGGQFYNGQPIKGSVMLGGTILAFATMREERTIYFMGRDIGTEYRVRPLNLALMAGLSIWSIFDAYIIAERINETHGFTFDIDTKNMRMAYNIKF